MTEIEEIECKLFLISLYVQLNVCIKNSKIRRIKEQLIGILFTHRNQDKTITGIRNF